MGGKRRRGGGWWVGPGGKDCTKGGVSHRSVPNILNIPGGSSGGSGFSNRGGTHKNEIFPICSKYDSECSKLL